MKIKDDSRRQKWVKQCTVGCSQMPNSKQRAALIPPRMSFAKHILIWCSIWFEFHRFAKINWQLCTPCNLCIIYFLKLIIFILFIRLLWLWLDVFSSVFHCHYLFIFFSLFRCAVIFACLFYIRWILIGLWQMHTRQVAWFIFEYTIFKHIM